MNVSGSHPLVKFVAFAALCLVFAVWLVVTIGNIHPFANWVSYEAVISDTTGLVPNDSVKVSGVPVGKVQSIHVERGNAVVRFAVRDDIELGEDTTVGVRWRNLLGLRYLYVYPAGDGDLNPGHRFPLERTFGAESFGRLMERLVPVQNALDPEVGNVVVRSLAEALSNREERVQRLISEAASLTNTLADRDEQIGRILENGAELAGAYAEREQALRDLLDRFANVSETIAGRNDEIERIIVDVADAQEELARFVRENDEEIHGTIDGLDDLTAVLSVNRSNLEDILTHLGRGLAFYHRTSRWGQWFNVRVAGASDGGSTFSTERGASLPPRCEGQEAEGFECEQSESQGPAGFFRSGLVTPPSAVTSGGDR